jgi:hypothetical protein
MWRRGRREVGMAELGGRWGCAWAASALRTIGNQRSTAVTTGF